MDNTDAALTNSPLPITQGPPVKASTIPLTTPFAEVLPSASAHENETLRNLWEANGRSFNQSGIATDDYRLLDGHRRLEIDPDLAIVFIPGTSSWSEERCKAWIYAHSLAARNLSPEQKWVIDRERKANAKKLKEQEFTYQEIADINGVSVSTVHGWLNKGSVFAPENASYPDCRRKVQYTDYPEIYQRYKDGESIRDIAGDYKRCEKTISLIIKKQQRIERLILDGEEEAARQLEFDPQRTLTLKNEYCYEFMLTLPDESIDLILTDIPYTYEDIFEECAAEFLAQHAVRLLKPKGLLVMYPGKEYTDQVRYIIDQNSSLQGGNYLAHRQRVTVIYNDPRKEFLSGTVLQYSRQAPVLVYSKLGVKFEERIPHNDVVFGGSKENDLFEWQKTKQEMAGLVEIFSKPGDTILDPYMGVGTTGIPALLGGRKFIGIEAEHERYLTASGRLSSLTEDAQKYLELVKLALPSQRKFSVSVDGEVS